MNKEDLADQLFFQWRSVIKDLDKDDRYGSGAIRRSNIDMLIYSFYENNIDFNLAMDYKRKVAEMLSTPNNRNEKKKPGGWREGVAETYEEAASAVLCAAKLSNPEDIKILSLDELESWMLYTDPNGAIRDWLSCKYGFSSAKYKLACTIGHELNKEFAKETMDLLL